MLLRSFLAVLSVSVAVVCAQEKPAEILLSGQVLLPDGKPAPNAEVGIIVLEYAAQQMMVRHAGKFTTDAEGYYSGKIDANSASRQAGMIAVARKAPYALGWATLNPQATGTNSLPMDIRLSERATISGRVVSDTGTPVAGARITIPILLNRKTQPPQYLINPPDTEFFAATTAEDGSFVLEDVPSESHAMLRVRAAGHGETFLPAGQFGSNADLIEAGSEAVEVVLPQECTLGGIVRRGTGGKPVPGATVVLRVGPSFLALSQATTDDDGRFEFRGLAPDTPGQLHTAKAEGRNEEAAPVLVELAPGEKKTDIEMVLMQRGSVEIHLKTDKGVPVPNASVNLQSQTGRTGKQGRTDAAGVVKIDLLPGQWRFTLSFPGGRHSPNEALTVEPGRTTVHEVVLSGFEGCSGVVLAPDGTPLAGAQVTAVPAYRPVTSGEDGSFKLSWYVSENSSRRPKGILIRHAERNLVSVSPLPPEDAGIEITTSA